MAQLLRPDSNIQITNITGGFADIDEAVASDVDYAHSPNQTNTAFEVGLTNPAATPDVGSVLVRYRVAQVNNGTVDGSGSAASIVVSLMQGATTIATDVSRTGTGTWTTYTLTIADPSAITDWTDLRLLFSITGSGGSPANRRGMAVSWAEVETPDPPSSINSGAGSSAGTSTGSATGFAFATAGAGSASGTSTAVGVSPPVTLVVQQATNITGVISGQASVTLNGVVPGRLLMALGSANSDSNTPPPAPTLDASWVQQTNSIQDQILNVEVITLGFKVATSSSVSASYGYYTGTVGAGNSITLFELNIVPNGTLTALTGEINTVTASTSNATLTTPSAAPFLIGIGAGGFADLTPIFGGELNSSAGAWVQSNVLGNPGDALSINPSAEPVSASVATPGDTGQS